MLFEIVAGDLGKPARSVGAKTLSRSPTCSVSLLGAASLAHRSSSRVDARPRKKRFVKFEPETGSFYAVSHRSPAVSDDAGRKRRAGALRAMIHEHFNTNDAVGLNGRCPSERRAVLEEAALLYEFLAERLPAVLKEWHERRTSDP
jgi:hypothetical protein